jgi:hypothetical protein
MDTASIFNDLYTALTEARCQVRVGGKGVVERCLCSGIGKDRESSEQGQYQAVSAEVRFLAADETTGTQVPNGLEIEIKVDGSDVWQKFRIGGRHVSGAVLRLTLEAVHG